MSRAKPAWQWITLKPRATTGSCLACSETLVAGKPAVYQYGVGSVCGRCVFQLRKMMARADITNAEKYRAIMEAYQVENEFGRTIEAYRSTIERDGKEMTVDFLRFGRIALVYQTLDGNESGVWDQAARAWGPLDNSYRGSIRDGLRVARKQSAPDLIRLPVPVAQRVEEAS